MSDSSDDVRHAQRRVAEFLADHDLEAPPAYRLLDLHSELGEVAKEVAESTGYGTDPDEVAVATDEVGDALFALLAFSESVGIDAEEALRVALEKYERRIDDTGAPSSGE